MITATTKSALKKTSMALAAAAIATLTIQGSAEAGHHGHGHHGHHGHHRPHVIFDIGAPLGYWGVGYVDSNPCKHWKRKYHRTGRVRFLRKYRRCMRRYF